MVFLVQSIQPQRKVCPLPFSHGAKTDPNQSKTAKAAQKPAFQTVPQNQPQSQTDQAASVHMALPAHKNTPCTDYAEGVVHIHSFYSPSRTALHSARTLLSTGTQVWLP